MDCKENEELRVGFTKDKKTKKCSTDSDSVELEQKECNKQLSVSSEEDAEMKEKGRTIFGSEETLKQ